MELLKRLLIPSRADGIFLVSTIVFIAGFLFWFLAPAVATNGNVSQFLFMVVIPAALCSIACGACCGWWNFGRWRLFFLLIACVSSFHLPLLISWLTGIKPPTRHQLGIYYWWERFSDTANTNKFNEKLLWGAAIITGCFIGTSILILAFKYIPVCIASLINIITSRFKMKFELTRAKLLVAIASMLLVVGIVNNILIANDIDIFKTRDPVLAGIARLVAGFVFYVIAFGVIVQWPTWALLKGKGFWIPVWGALTLFLPVVLVAVTLEMRTSRGIPALDRIALFAIATVWFLFVIHCLKRKESHSPKPTVWSFAVGVFGLAGLLSPHFLDYAQFITGASYNKSDLTFEENLKNAWRSGTLFRKSGGALRGANGIYYLKSDTESAADVLKNVDWSLPSERLTIANIPAHVDSSLLASSKITQVSVVNAALTGQQLSDIADSAIGMLDFEDVEIDSQGKVKINSNVLTQLYFDEPAELASFLQSIDCANSRALLIINSKVSAAAWPEIVRVSQNRPVFLAGELDHDIGDAKDSPLSAKNITLALGSTGLGKRDSLTRKQMQFILRTDARIDNRSFLSNPASFWDLVFAYPNRVDFAQLGNQTNLLTNIFNSTRNSGIYEQRHLVFGKDSKGNITDLFFPDGINFGQLRQLKKLKRLSTDVNWLSDNTLLSVIQLEDLSGLRNFIDLEELYLSDCSLLVNDLSSLTPLKKLKHLQIPTLKNAVRQVGFDACQSLQSITLFGMPDKKTIAEFTRLPKLQKLIVVDSNNEILDSTKTLAALQKILPNADIKIVPAGQAFADIPEKFRQHLINKKKEIQDKLFGPERNEPSENRDP